MNKSALVLLAISTFFTASVMAEESMTVVNEPVVVVDQPAAVVNEPAVATKRHRKETSIAGYFQKQTSPDSSTTLFVKVDEGFYFTPRFLGMVSVNGLVTGSGNNQVTMMNVGVGLKYYFRDAAKARVVPFVLGNVGLSILDLPYSKTYFCGTTCAPYTINYTDALLGYSAQAGVGMAIFMTEDVSTDISLQFYSNNYSAGVYYPSMSQSGAVLNFGITARF